MAAIATGQFGSSSLDQLGVTVDETGTMSLDTDTLDAALAANPNALSDRSSTAAWRARSNS